MISFFLEIHKRKNYVRLTYKKSKHNCCSIVCFLFCLITSPTFKCICNPLRGSKPSNWKLWYGLLHIIYLLLSPQWHFEIAHKFDNVSPTQTEILNKASNCWDNFKMEGVAQQRLCLWISKTSCHSSPFHLWQIS